MNEIELKPCPFCGGEAELHKTKLYLCEAVQIHCKKCSVHTPKEVFNHLLYTEGKEIYVTQTMATENVTKRWNRRSENVIELPCAIGTTIYELIFEKEDPCSWCKHDHSGFGDYICDLDYDHYPQVKDFINGEKICPEFQMTIIDRTFDLAFCHYDKDWFNITWFLTKEEAEKALAKLKGGAE